MSGRFFALVLAAVLALGLRGYADEVGEEELPPPYHQLVLDMNKNLGRQFFDKEVRLPTAEEIKEMGDLWPTLPPEENAAFLYARAFAHLTYLRRDEYPPGSMSGNHRSFDGNVEPLRRFVNRQSKAIAFARQAAQMEKCVFPPLVAGEGDRRNGLHAPRAHFRQLARVIGDAALAAEGEGRTNEAADLCLLTLRMGRHLYQEQIIGAMVGDAVALIGNTVLERLMANSDLQRRTLERVIQTAAECEIPITQLREIVGRDLDALRWTMTGIEWKDSRKWLNFAGTKEQYLALLDRSARSLQDALEVPLHVSLAPEYDLKTRLRDGIPPEAMVTYAISGRDFLQGFGSFAVRRRGLQIRAAIKLYVQDNGHAPDTLQQLCPTYLAALPLDPFSGKPFLYKKDGDRWKFYSVGTNLQDDGGATDDSMISWARDQPDFVFLDRLKSNLASRMRREDD